MRIFVVEYITGGGLANSSLNDPRLPEAQAMLEALLCDLSGIGGVHVLTSRDGRLPPLVPRIDTYIPDPECDLWSSWATCMNSCDAVWPIAPESSDLLYRLSVLTLKANRTLLGSAPSAVAVASSKLDTARCLAANGIIAVPSFDASTSIPFCEGRWVLKPDDGVGCEDLRIFDDYVSMQRARRQLISSSTRRHVAQPFVEGVPASLSLICSNGRARLLSVNRQHLEEVGGRLHLSAVTTGGLAKTAQMMRLAQSIAEALPGLWGYVGVDIIWTAEGPLVVEINPRLTMSYCRLGSVLHTNPAEEVLDLASRRARPAARARGAGAPEPTAGTNASVG